MNPNVFALAEDLTAGEAITALQAARDVEMVFYLYVVDERRHLVGVVSLRRLLLVPPDTPLKRIMTTDVYSVRVETDQEEVARQVASYNLLAIPVVDSENKLTGVITVDDVIDVIKDEATEDVFRLAGVSRDDGVLTPPYDSLPPAAAVAAREPGDGVPGGLGRRPLHRDDQPGADSCDVHAGRGRHGRQRRHADAGRDRARSRTRRADVEQRASGALQGRARRHWQRPGDRLVGALVAWAISRDWRIALILMAAMMINMFVAAIAGTLVPLGLRALKIDPALASSVFITTVTDMSGFLSFLGLATLFLTVGDGALFHRSACFGDRAFETARSVARHALSPETVNLWKRAPSPI